MKRGKWWTSRLLNSKLVNPKNSKLVNLLLRFFDTHFRPTELNVFIKTPKLTIFDRDRSQ